MIISEHKRIMTLVKRSYGLTVDRVQDMEGYDSINFKLSAATATYVLKQYPSPFDQELLKAENEVLHRLEDLKPYQIPKVVMTEDGADILVQDDRCFRLLTYVHGDLLAEMEHSPEMISSFGSFMGRLTKETVGLSLAAVKSREISWDIKHTLKSESYLDHIKDPTNRNLVRYFLMQFREQVLPRQYQLRTGIIHNDANDHNVLVHQNKMKGIIDFGDMCHTWVINDAAIAMTYLLMDKKDPLRCAVYFLTAYHEVYPLQEREIAILYYLIAARLCISVCHSAHAKHQKPYSDYIVVSERPAWKLLHTWLTINPLKAENVFKNAIGCTGRTAPKTEDLIVKRYAVLGKSLSISYDDPISMTRSAFQYMYDADGNTFLDAYNNIMLAGHCHPHVVYAGQRALAKLNTNTRYLYEELTDYAQHLLSLFPKTLNKVFFVNSGSAASDLAYVWPKSIHKRKKSWS